MLTPENKWSRSQLLGLVSWTGLMSKSFIRYTIPREFHLSNDPQAILSYFWRSMKDH